MISPWLCTHIHAKTCETLLDSCIDIMRRASENLEQIEKNEYVLKNLIDSKLMKWFSIGLKFAENEGSN